MEQLATTFCAKIELAGFFFGVWAKTRFAKKSRNSIFTQKLDFQRAKTRFFSQYFYNLAPFYTRKFQYITKSVKKAHFRPKNCQKTQKLDSQMQKLDLKCKISI